MDGFEDRIRQIVREEIAAQGGEPAQQRNALIVGAAAIAKALFDDDGPKAQRRVYDYAERAIAPIRRVGGRLAMTRTDVERFLRRPTEDPPED